MNVIDPHIHLFNLESGEYNWLKPNNPPLWTDKPTINRSFDVADLTLNSLMSLSGFVHIEAGFNNAKPWLEVEWLEEHVDIPFKAIASADITLAPKDFITLIDKLKDYRSVVGVRHIFDEDAVNILTHKNTSTNLNYLEKTGFIFETQLNGGDDEAVLHFCQMANAHQALTLILSHANFCPLNTNKVKDNEVKGWRDNIKLLATNNNILIKASGWEMINRSYTIKHIEEVVSHLLSNFGATRIMLASNFPLTLFSQSYNALWQSYLTLNFDEGVLDLLMHDNAQRVYKIR